MIYFNKQKIKKLCWVFENVCFYGIEDIGEFANNKQPKSKDCQEDKLFKVNISLCSRFTFGCNQ